MESHTAVLRLLLQRIALLLDRFFVSLPSLFQLLASRLAIIFNFREEPRDHRERERQRDVFDDSLQRSERAQISALRRILDRDRSDADRFPSLDRSFFPRDDRSDSILARLR